MYREVLLSVHHLQLNGNVKVPKIFPMGDDNDNKSDHSDKH